ncbi:hypothetical protein OESDEN_17950 [Oesophagostomum dentatum]|uniref:G domain-containing protein n=1 Tax=Oesophagostomum dentatum TaxID=61180 RepID=A0A0B1SEN0_OESDE|nr:hypothetical protein OESDEN_17950 [Oesophagostomum dentatum]
MSLTDTAGIRHTADTIEKEGVERAKQKILDADLVIVVIEAGSSTEETRSILEEIERSTERTLPLIIVRNKSDLWKGERLMEVKSTSRLEVLDCVNTCALTADGVRTLMEALKRFVQNLCPDDSGPCLTDTQLLR